MEVVALVLGGVLLVGLVAFVNRDTPARRERLKWATAAKNLGLRGEPGRLHGVLDGVEIELSLVDAESPRPSMRVTATAEGGPSLELGQWTEGISREGSIRTGHKRFDRAHVVHGDRPIALATLSADVRDRLLEYASAREVQLCEGVLTMSVLGAPRDVARVMELARQGARLAADLSRSPDDVVARLSHAASADDCGPYRHRCLQLLLIRHRDRPETEHAVHYALQDSEPEVRVLAAVEAGSEGLPILEAVLADPDADYKLRDEAAFTVAKTAAVSRLKELLGAYLVDGHPLRKRAVEQMIARGADPGLGPLLTMLQSDDTDEICVGARCLGAHGYHQAEVTLVQLVRHGDRRVQVGVVHALGQVGTTRSLGILKKTTVNPDSGARFMRAAMVAVRRIEARATIPSPG